MLTPSRQSMLTPSRQSISTSMSVSKSKKRSKQSIYRRPSSLMNDVPLMSRLASRPITTQIKKLSSPIVLDHTNSIAYKINYEFGRVLQYALFDNSTVFEYISYVMLINWTIAWCFFLNIVYLNISFVIAFMLFLLPILLSTNVNILKSMIQSFYGAYFTLNSVVFLFIYAYLFERSHQFTAWFSFISLIVTHYIWICIDGWILRRNMIIVASFWLPSVHLIILFRLLFRVYPFENGSQSQYIDSAASNGVMKTMALLFGINIVLLMYRNAVRLTVAQHRFACVFVAPKKILYHPTDDAMDDTLNNSIRNHSASTVSVSASTHKRKKKHRFMPSNDSRHTKDASESEKAQFVSPIQGAPIPPPVGVVGTHLPPLREQSMSHSQSQSGSFEAGVLPKTRNNGHLRQHSLNESYSGMPLEHIREEESVELSIQL